MDSKLESSAEGQMRPRTVPAPEVLDVQKMLDNEASQEKKEKNDE
jgi:hypothetical protein